MARKDKSVLDLQRSADRFLEKSFVDEVAPLINSEVEFSHIQLKDIIVHDQVRSKDELQAEKLEDLIHSIDEKGVLQPVLVFRSPEKDSHKYILIAGERRYLASKALNRPHIPARILLKEPTDSEMLEIQLVENLQRKDLNVIDEALGYIKYYSTRLKYSDLKLDQLSNDLYSFTTRPEGLDKEVAIIIIAIEKLSGKSIHYVRKIISLCRLPEQAITAVKNGELNLTQALVFVDNLQHPKFDTILAKALTRKMPAKSIEALFREKTLKKPAFSVYKTRINKLSKDIEKNYEDISKDFAKQLLSQTENLLKTIKAILEKK